MVDHARSSHVDVNGLSLRILEWEPMATNEQPSIVLVHGLASNALLWQGAATALAERGHRVVAIDQRGHGQSTKPESGYDMATVTRDLAALLEVLVSRGFDRPVVAGQSWGGNVVLELASRHPDRVRGIACVDGGWLEPSSVFASWEQCETVLAPPRLAGLHRSDVEGYGPTVVPRELKAWVNVNRLDAVRGSPSAAT